MGYYINPIGMSKEEWLLINGEHIHWSDALIVDMTEYTPVCLVDNGGFTAAAICYNVEEADRFLNPNDTRPKMWFLVETAKLKVFM